MRNKTVFRCFFKCVLRYINAMNFIGGNMFQKLHTWTTTNIEDALPMESIWKQECQAVHA